MIAPRQTALRATATLAVTVTALALAGTFSARAQSCLDYGSQVRWLSSLYGFDSAHTEWGGLKDIAVEGNCACVLESTNSNLTLVDLGDAVYPRRRGSVTLPGDLSSHSVVILRGLACVADGDSGLVVVDITDPDRPALLATLRTDCPAWSVASEESLIAVCCPDYTPSARHSLKLFVRGPAGVEPRGSLTLPDRPGRAFLEGGLACVICSDPAGSTLRFVDVSDPRAPAPLGTLPLSGDPTDVVLKGSRAYVTLAQIGIGVVNCADPWHPQLVWTTAMSALSRVRLFEGVLVASTYGGWSTISLANPDRPALLGALPSPGGQITGLTVTDKLVVLATFSSLSWMERAGVQVFAAESLVPPPLRTTLPGVPTSAEDVALWDNHAYVVSSSALDVIDLSSPDAPLDLRRTPLPFCWSYRLAASGARLYRVGTSGTAADSVRLQIYDLATPAAPAGQGACTFGLRGYFSLDELPLAAGGAMVCVARKDAIVIIDATNTTDPRPIGHIGTTGNIGALLMSDSYLFATVDWSAVSIYDLSTPASPNLVRTLVQAGADALALRGHTLFVSAGQALFAYDVSDPAAPRLLDTLDSPARLFELATAGGYVYGRGAGQVHVFDARNPSLISYVGATGASNGLTGLAASGELVALSGSFGSGLDASGFALAWPQCGALLPALVSDLGASTEGGTVTLGWSITGDCAGMELRMSGCSGAQRWAVPVADLGSCRFRATDVPATCGAEILYVLEGRGADGLWTHLGEQRVTLPGATPLALRLLGASPNPFNPSTTLRFELSSPTRVVLAVYDQRGRLVRTLVDEPLTAGPHTAEWNGCDRNGRPSPSGTFVARLVTEQGIRAVKLLLTR